MQKNENPVKKSPISILSVIALMMSALGLILYPIVLSNATIAPLWLIISICSIVMPPFAKKDRINKNKRGTGIEIIAIIIGGFNFYCIIFAITQFPIFIGYLGWIICGVIYKFTAQDKVKEMEAVQIAKEKAEAKKHQYDCERIEILKENKEGTCQICRSSNIQVSLCEIKNRVGTRNVFLCEECINKYNSSKEK